VQGVLSTCFRVMLCVVSPVSQELRLPAPARPQRLHNVGLALGAFAASGVRLAEVHPGGIDAAHIVDGHRSRTLALLWALIAVFKLPALLDTAALQAETAAVRAQFARRERSAHQVRPT
jgi:abnormal spindle-like microcephaly-associated protein